MNAMDDLRQNIRDNLNQALPRTGRAEGIFWLKFKIVVIVFGEILPNFLFVLFLGIFVKQKYTTLKMVWNVNCDEEFCSMLTKDEFDSFDNNGDGSLTLEEFLENTRQNQ